MNRICLIICLILSISGTWAQTLWFKPDSLISLPHEDSILPHEEYTVIAVLKSLEEETPQLLWGIKSADTLQSAFLTNAHFSSKGGVFTSQSIRDYSKWCICYYHTGCRKDTTGSYALWLGSTPIYYADTAWHSDSITAHVSIRELLFTTSSMTKVEKAAWQSYMAMKYGITLDNAPYLSPAADTLWHHERDAEYYHRIVAVGVDSLHEWSASASVSYENASLLLLCPDSLHEGEYILLGDNNMEETWSSAPSGYDYLMRSWRLRSYLQGNGRCSLVWTPSVSVASPDSVWLEVCDSLDNPVGCIGVDSIVGDSSWFFTLSSLLPLQSIAIRTTHSVTDEDAGSVVSYNASSGTLSLPMLDPDKIYTYALYTNLGHLLYWPAPSRPDCIQVGNLPTGIYRIEAFFNNQMEASVSILVQ